MAGDLIAAMIGVPPVGGALDAVLKPLYTDTLLAWFSLKSTARASNSGWSRYFEYCQSSSDRAYTLETLASVRAGLHHTRSWFSAEIVVADGAPWYIGDNGQGHFFVGDRIGVQVAGDFSDQIYIDRVRELTISWDSDNPAQWKPVIGEREKNQDRGARALQMMNDAFGSLRDLGVFG